MSSSYFGHRIIHLESVDSTNNYTAKVFKSEEVQAGAVIMADIQTDGRGQREKTWQSGAFENLTFSLTADIKLWKINTLIDLNRLIAIALHSFFTEFALEPEIKWPNDIMIKGQKISGILIENFFKEGMPKSIIGIGININQKEFDFPRATSLAKLTGRNYNTRELLFKFLKVVNEVFEKTLLLDSTSIHQEFDRRLWKLNQTHNFKLSTNETVEGVLEGTAESGELLVQINNEIKTYSNGKITY